MATWACAHVVKTPGCGSDEEKETNESVAMESPMAYHSSGTCPMSLFCSFVRSSGHVATLDIKPRMLEQHISLYNTTMIQRHEATQMFACANMARLFADTLMHLTGGAMCVAFAQLARLRSKWESRLVCRLSMDTTIFLVRKSPRFLPTNRFFPGPPLPA